MVGVLGVLVGVLVAVVLGSSVRRVPEGTVAVVERFGRYARTLRPGTALLLPMAERVRNRIDVQEQTVPLRVVGTDAQGRPVVLQLRLRYKVVDPGPPPTVSRPPARPWSSCSTSPHATRWRRNRPTSCAGICSRWRTGCWPC
ncbi:SPFH domain-containing protein [Streptacidiphilus monticola]